MEPGIRTNVFRSWSILVHGFSRSHYNIKIEKNSRHLFTRKWRVKFLFTYLVLFFPFSSISASMFLKPSLTSCVKVSLNLPYCFDFSSPKFQ